MANVPVRFTFGKSRYHADIWDDPSHPTPSNPLDPDVVTLDPARGRLGYTFLRGEVVGEREGGRPARWTVGLEVTEQFSQQSGAILPPHAVGEARRVLEGHQLQYGVLFADYRLEPRPDLTIQAGVRWETGSQVANVGQDRVAPRLSLRFRMNPRLSVSAAYGRSYQYAQPIGGAGKPFGPQFHYAQTWLLAGTQSPVLRSDVGTLGVERWLGGTWLASATGYVRHATGVAMEDPRPGSVFPVGWPGVEPRSAWVDGTNTAFGLEMGVRRLAGRVTGSAAYSLGVSNFKMGQLDFASPADRRHVLDATLMARARDNLLFGAAFTAASGAPFTRTFNDYCHDWPDAEGNCPAPATGPITFRGPPNAERGPTYASLDLLLDWTSRRSGWSWGAYLQVRNVLGRDNMGVFVETTCGADSYVGGGCSSPELLTDSFEGGLSFPLPLFGFRLTF
ncbi:MAG: TonB-dependent receptor [Longimicrobiales bacterium]